jgi:hypothetical protein
MTYGNGRDANGDAGQACVLLVDDNPADLHAASQSLPRLPVGMVGGIDYDGEKPSLRPGDRLYLCSGGLAEG